MPVATLLWGSLQPETRNWNLCVRCDTAVTKAPGPLQPYGTDRTGPMVNPQVCAVV